jgi:GNAT superfamily N-acetyltransferase
MTITRKAGKEDLEQLSVLFDSYRIFYHQSSDIAAARQFLQERMEKKESVIFVAENENILAGFTQLYPIFSSVGLKRAWLLNDLYVHASYRQQGIAAKLLDAARQFGIQAHAGWLLLQTNAGNYSAQSVYEKNGWKKITDFFYELSLPE